MIDSLDFETRLISDLEPVPAIVCGSSSSYDDNNTWILGGDAQGLEELRDSVARLLEGGGKIVGHNMKFDMLCASRQWPELQPLILDAYEDGRISCTVIREKLTDNSIGRLSSIKGYYSLGSCVERHKLGSFTEAEKGEDAWRMRYAELEGVPVSEWPEDAFSYPLKDAELTLDLYLSQNNRGEKYRCPMADETLQAAADFCLGKISARGIFTDKARVEALEAELAVVAEKHAIGLLKSGLASIKVIHKNCPEKRREEFKKHAKVLQERVEDYVEHPTRTAKGSVKVDAQTLRELPVEVPGVDSWLGFMKVEKMLGTFIPAVSRGIGETPVRPYFDVLKETGRCSSSKPNLQQVPRKGGFRECFRARPGFVFVNADYDSQEMRAWAEVTSTLQGIPSRLARFYREDPRFDPHSLFAAEVFLSCSYEECKRRVAGGDQEAIDARQRSKAANFGYPGGLGAASFVSYAKGYGLNLTLRESTKIRNDWFRTWPEARHYLKWASKTAKGGRVTQIWSERLRGRCSFTQVANTMFQGLAGDATKLALWFVMKECLGGSLEGSHVVLVIHDEIMLESPEHLAEEHAERLVSIMEKAQETVTPTVPARAGYNINKYWSK